jgi:hypothetical protein
METNNGDARYQTPYDQFKVLNIIILRATLTSMSLINLKLTKTTEMMICSKNTISSKASIRHLSANYALLNEILLYLQV